MIVITAPTGQIGRQVLANVLNSAKPIRGRTLTRFGTSSAKCPMSGSRFLTIARARRLQEGREKREKCQGNDARGERPSHVSSESLALARSGVVTLIYLPPIAPA